MVKSVYDLDVYQSAYRLALELHKTALNFPKEEQFALSSQMRRASKSICANLAEGFAKSHKSPAEFRRFCLIALGSAEETKVWIDFARDLDYISVSQSDSWKTGYTTICKQLNKLIESIKS